MLEISIAIAVASLAISWAATACFKIKYSDAKHNQNLQARLDKIEDLVSKVEAHKILDLEIEVRGLKNVAGLAPRAKR